MKLSPAIVIKKERLRDASISSISSAGSGSRNSRSPVPELDSRHPDWSSNVVQYARQRAGKNLFRSDFDLQEFEKSISKVVLQSTYPFTEETTVDFVNTIVETFARGCSS